MSDKNPSWWRSPITREEWERELAEAKENRRKAREAWEKAKEVEAAIYQMRIAQAEGDYNKRNWSIWRERILKGTTYKQLGLDYGVTLGRIVEIVQTYDNKVNAALQPGLNVQWDNVSDDIREATLDVEFVFRNELTFDNEEEMKGWKQLEPTEYIPPRPEWLRELGRTDDRPPKANTYYQVRAPKEQTND
jgi:hypothetical protein